MRLLSLCSALAFALAGVAADKAEDKAKDAAVAFLKAVKTKDADAAAKLCDAPFAYKDGELKVHRDADALKTWLKEKLGEIKEPEKVPTTVDEVMTFESLKDKIKGDDEKKIAEEVMGKDGYMAIVMSSDSKKVGIAVRMKDGKARIVGLIR